MKIVKIIKLTIFYGFSMTCHEKISLETCKIKN